ncbi:MAG: RDD family protein [Acidobacteriota bacterium]|nr:RDD family protein [Acidobacteriota bacterium]
MGERVREIQERRAREAALEPGNCVREIDEIPSRTTGPLELLPQAEVPPLNPLVVAALRRIERAHVSSHCGSNATAMAVAFEEQPELGEDMSHTADDASSGAVPHQEQSTQSERLHNLAVVPTSAVGMADTSEVIRKPRRLIAGDLNDPALNYLDAIPTLRVEKREYHAASIPYRVLSSIVDLVVICLLSSPLVALVKLTELNWQDLRVLTFAAATSMIVAFLYLTISIALTGRTLGMRVFSLRVVDDRTGLIPTGRQSAGRAAIYLLSLAVAGIALLYVFFDAEKHTAHDRYTRTAVIRV